MSLRTEEAVAWLATACATGLTPMVAADPGKRGSMRESVNASLDGAREARMLYAGLENREREEGKIAACARLLLDLSKAPRS